MQNKDKTVATAFRITEGTAEKFREISKDLGGNQQTAMAKLIEVYELEMGKDSIPEMRENIETFEGFIRTATNMYLQALEVNQNMRAIVRSEYESQLKSKDKLIEELQSERDSARESRDESLAKEHDYQNTIEELVKENKTLEDSIIDVEREKAEEIKKFEAAYALLENRFHDLQTSETSIRESLSGFMKENQLLKDEIASLKKNHAQNAATLSEMEQKISSLTIELEVEKKNAEAEKTSLQKEFEHEIELLIVNHKLEIQEKINELESQHKVELGLVNNSAHDEPGIPA